jgi:hypothetical protein
MWHGGRVVAAPRAHSSRRCSRCGHVHADNRASQSVFLRKVRGDAENATFNAARNTLRRGIETGGHPGEPVNRAGLPVRRGNAVPPNAESRPFRTGNSHPSRGRRPADDAMSDCHPIAADIVLNAAPFHVRRADLLAFPVQRECRLQGFRRLPARRSHKPGWQGRVSGATLAVGNLMHRRRDTVPFTLVPTEPSEPVEAVPRLGRCLRRDSVPLGKYRAMEADRALHASYSEISSRKQNRRLWRRCAFPLPEGSGRPAMLR